MKINRFFCRGVVSFVGLMVLILRLQGAGADPVRTQVVNLRQGWNAVYLEVTPTNSKPAVCFQGTPVSMVAAYVGDGSAVQYVQNPSTNSINSRNGWLVWYAPNRADAFLTRLFSLNGNTSYLVYSTSAYQWSVTGYVTVAGVKWKPDSFSFVGMGVDGVSPPTFSQFFAASEAHKPARIYRLLDNGQWALIDNPQNTQMRSGEACWIYCKGSSDYQGPLTVQIQNNASTVALAAANPVGILLANKSSNPLAVRVDRVGGDSDMPLAFLLRAVTDTNVVTATFDLPAVYNMEAFEAGERRGLWLTLRPERMAASPQATLLKITTDLGTQSWVPITGIRTETSSAN